MRRAEVLSSLVAWYMQMWQTNPPSLFPVPLALRSVFGSKRGSPSGLIRGIPTNALEVDGPRCPKTRRSEKSHTEWSQTDPSPHSTRTSTLTCVRDSLLQCLRPKMQTRRWWRLGRGDNKTSTSFKNKKRQSRSRLSSPSKTNDF